MYKQSYFSKLLSLIICSLTIVITSTSCNHNPIKSGEQYLIAPMDSDDDIDRRWAEYLYTHMMRRGGEEAPVSYGTSPFNDNLKVNIHVDKNLNGDFVIKNGDKSINLTAKDDRTMLWLIYQFMRKAGDADNTFAVSDLPMSLISFNDTIGHFPIRYRDVYLPTNLDSDMSGILCTHNIDNDWGLWGHNIGKILPEEVSEEIYAQVNGTRKKKQYCFSSDKLYNYIAEYIIDNHGEGDKCHHNFAILPNDNDIVCQCPECIKAGNTNYSATPSSTNMLRRLSKRFPELQFFTIAYRTTKDACKDPLPENCGVLVSAINWPAGVKFDDKLATKFRKKLTNWQKKTDNIYVWDYINNFDDYLTPFPILRTMQYRLQTYCDLGVKGLFLNGSGYDYSTFEYFHTCILSALMLNPYMPLETLINDHFGRRFPVAGTICRDYYMELMDAFEESGRTMTWYSGIEDSEEEFLNRERFIVFYKKLSEVIKSTNDEEEFRLRRLITALTFTRLEIARHAGYTDSIGYAQLDGNTIKPENKIINYLHRLACSHKLLGFNVYSETGGNIDEYIRNWKKLVLVPEHYSSLLFGKKLTIHTGGKTFSTHDLTDGQPGLPDSYHAGWTQLSPSGAQIIIPGKLAQNASRLRFNFLQMTRHRISVPKSVEIWQSGKMLRSITPKPNSPLDKVGIAFCDIPLGKIGNGDITIKISSTGIGNNIGIDEIYLTPKSNE